MASLQNSTVENNIKYSVAYGYKDVNDFVREKAKGLATELGVQAYKVMYDKVNESIYGDLPSTYVHSYGFLNAVTMSETYRNGQGWTVDIFIDPYVLQETSEPRSLERSGWTVHQSFEGDKSISQMNAVIEVLENGGGTLYEHKAHGFIEATRKYLQDMMPQIKDSKSLEGFSKLSKYGRGYSSEGDHESHARGASVYFSNR